MSDAVVPLVTCALGWLVWNGRLSALARSARAPDAAGGSFSGRVSLVVPARDEAENLPALLASIARLDPAPAQCIVVDDHSTDATGALARASGALVVTPEPLPRGWMGKPWACARGAAEADGEFLLFTDADTVHAPGSLGLAMAHLRETGADLLSVVPTHVAAAPWEHLQGVFQLLLLVSTRAGSTTRTRGERDFCIGQYLLFRRAAYERVGRHEAVRDRVAEDLAFARMVRDTGGRYALLLSPGALRVRMYPEGFFSFVRGWRRNFREGFSSVGAQGLLETIVVVAWLFGAPFGLALGLVDVAHGGTPYGALANAGSLALAVYEVARRQRLAGEFSPASALAYPLFVATFIAVTALAAWDLLRRAPVRWRGRMIARGAA